MLRIFAVVKRFSLKRTFVIGDIHGAHQALLQCFERARFSPMYDRLICLGDICDRREGVKQVMDELLGIRDLIFIRGNHDQWALDWMKAPGEGLSFMPIWLKQGGEETMRSYSGGVPKTHLDLIASSVYYFILDNLLFVHGGIDPDFPIKTQSPENFLWDRNLVAAALNCEGKLQRFTQFDEVFVGHTPTLNFDRLAVNDLPDRTYPMKFCNVWLMDTGAGWSGGKLSMMDLESREIFQSDILI